MWKGKQTFARPRKTDSLARSLPAPPHPEQAQTNESKKKTNTVSIVGRGLLPPGLHLYSFVKPKKEGNTQLVSNPKKKGKKDDTCHWCAIGVRRLHYCTLPLNPAHLVLRISVTSFRVKLLLIVSSETFVLTVKKNNNKNYRRLRR